MKRLFPLLLIALLMSSCGQADVGEQVNPEDTIATLVAATMNAIPSNTPVPTGSPAPPQPSETPSPSATPITPSPTPTLTHTPSATPTFTPVPGDPRDTLGIPTLEDTFKNSDNWSPYDSNRSKLEIKDGKMTLTAYKADNSEYWGISWPVVENFYLEYTGTFGDTCKGKDRFGMIFRAPKTSEGYNQGFLFTVTCDGHLRLYAWDGEEYTILQNWKKSEYVKSGPKAVNRIGIKAKGAKLTGYINGHQVVTKSSNLFTKGRFGAFIAAAETPGFSVDITRVSYWELP